MSYATVAQLRGYLTQTTNIVDATLQEILDRAHEILDEALGIPFAGYGEAVAKDILAAGGVWLDLPAHQAGTVTAVQALAYRGMAGESAQAITGYVEEEDGRLYCDAGWLEDVWYRVTAVWGYGPAPASVIEVELEVAVNIWQSRTSPIWAANAGAEGGGSVPVNRALAWAQRSILEGIRDKYLGVLHA